MALALFIILILLQVADGGFTLWGITVTHQIDYEKNFLVLYLINLIGPLPAIVIVKGSAMSFASLIFFTRKIKCGLYNIMRPEIILGCLSLVYFLCLGLHLVCVCLVLGRL